MTTLTAPVGSVTEHVTRRPVVVGVDGSSSALEAARWAAGYAARRGLPLRLVHVYVTPVAFPAGVVDARMVRSAMRDQGKRWLADARTAVAAEVADLVPDIVIEPAPIVPVLARESRTAAVLVLGTRGLGGFTGLLVGSSAMLLAERARCPLVVMRAGGDEYGPVVVGVDGLTTGEPTIAYAFAEASATGAELVAVHAWHDVGLSGHAGAAGHERARQAAVETLADRIAVWQEKYPDVRVRREVVRDHPPAALMRHASDARLVVVGTRGRGGFLGLAFGSTGQHLLHHAPCPVAIVRTEPAG